MAHEQIRAMSEIEILVKALLAVGRLTIFNTDTSQVWITVNPYGQYAGSLAYSAREDTLLEALQEVRRKLVHDNVTKE